MCGRRFLLTLLAPTVAALIAVYGGGVNDDFNLFTFGLGFVPTPWLINLASFIVWASTVKIRPAMNNLGLIEYENCFDQNESSVIRVMVAAPKGGAYYSGLLAHNIGSHCGLTMAIGTPAEDNWKDPPSDLLPKHEVDFLMAIGLSMNSWPEYLEEPFNVHKRLKCVVMTRNPFERFLSLYKYTRDAGESGLWLYAKELKKIKDFEDRVKYAWKEFGKMMMKRTHALLTDAMEMGCTQIKVDDLFFVSSEKHDELVETVLRTYGVRDEVVPNLLKIMEQNDINRRSEEEKAANRHISGKSLEIGEKEAVKKFIREDPGISKMLLLQCRDLKFDC